MPGKEGRDRNRLEVRPVERSDRIGLPELLERVAPRVPSERLATRSQGLRSSALGWRRQLAHWRRSYNRPDAHQRLCLPGRGPLHSKPTSQSLGLAATISSAFEV